MVQALGFVSGILIIRLLPVDEYALYILANSILGTITILSDAGISTGVMSESAKAWEDKKKLGIILTTGLRLRKKFTLFTLIVTIPLFILLLHKNGADYITILLIMAFIIPSFYAAISDSLLQIIPKLHRQVKPLQKNQIEVSVLRLIIIPISIFLLPFSYVAIAGNGISRIYGNFKLKKIAQKQISISNEYSKEVSKNIIKIIKKILPGAIYYAFAGQITIWILSIYGNTNSLASVGAIGRIAVLFGLVSTVVNMILVPEFSKIRNNQKKIIKIYTLIILATFILFLVLIIAINTFSHYIILILGSKYYGLDFELLLFCVGAGLATLTNISFGLISNKGLIVQPFLYIGINIILIISLISFFKIETLIGVLWYNIYFNLISCVIWVSYAYYRIIKHG